jgi:hypothetical protein
MQLPHQNPILACKGQIGATKSAVFDRQRIAPDRDAAPLPAARLEPCAMSDWSDEKTDDPLVADARNFYKVEKWTRDGMRVVDLLYAGSSVDRAHAIFATMVRHWPSIRLTIRQRTRVLQEWPPR